MRKDATGQILLAKGLITEAVLDRALDEQRSSGRRIGDILVDMGVVTRSQVLGALSEQLHVDVWNPAVQQPTAEVLDLLPESFARSRKVVPVARRGRTILVATEDPANLGVLEEIRVRTGLEPVPLLSSAEAIEQALERFYTLERIRSQVPSPAPNPRTDRTAGEGQGAQSPAAAMVNHILAEAIEMKASDVHIEPLEGRTRIRYRVAGVLQETASVPPEAHQPLVARLKVMAGADVAESRLPQDGRFSFRTGDARYNVRLSTMPVEYGEKVVLRILGKVGSTISIRDLGFDEELTGKLTRLLRRPAGLILVVGPSGSGKSTTLAACLDFLNDGHRNLVTVEDPVEHVIPGVNQVQVNPKTGLTFPVVLRHLMRQDPDCIMIGEIRDPETAQMALGAALTGHLVLASLHCKDSVEAPVRLKEMGCDPYLITSTLAGVVSQRLLRRLCPQCRQRVTLDEGEVRHLRGVFEATAVRTVLEDSSGEAGSSTVSAESKIRQERTPGGSTQKSGTQVQVPAGRTDVWRPAGCEKCSGLGYSGRKVVGEVLMPQEDFRRAFLRGAGPDELRKVAVRSGLRPMIEQALEAAWSGETSVEEVLRVFCPEPEGQR